MRKWLDFHSSMIQPTSNACVTMVRFNRLWSTFVYTKFVLDDY